MDNCVCHVVHLSEALLYSTAGYEVLYKLSHNVAPVLYAYGRVI
jgi:hypothetical protein